MKLADLEIESSLWSLGYKYVAGLDEVGRGSWVGPVVSAAVVLPINWRLPSGLTDSKLLTSKQRSELSVVIKREALAYSIAEVGLSVINKLGVGKAADWAFRRALRQLPVKSDYYLVDGFPIRYISKSCQRPIIRGDQKSASIAAASIIAKVYRDELMVRLAEAYPTYNWDHNKGYGTPRHQEAIRDFGFTPEHRTSFNLSYLLSN